MKTVHKGVMAAGLMAAFIAAPAAAQQKAFGFGVHGAWFQSGQLAENGATELDLDNNDAWGGGLEWWFGSRRVGLRADMTHTDSPFQLEFDSPIDDDIDNDGILDEDPQTELQGFGTVDTWMANANLMIRLLSPSEDRVFSPFVSIGGGFVRWDTENETVTDLRLETVDAQIYQEAQSEGAVFGSIGTDIFFTDNVALRLEAQDYWNPDSPYLVLSTLDGDRDHHGGGHNLLWTAGLQFMFGGGVEEPGFISVAPEPEPAPAPAPPPAPTTETVAMCYVDQSGRLQTVSATRNLSDGSIYVTRNGQDVMFTNAYPASEPYYVRSAQWYVASRPLIIDLSDGTTVMTADADVTLPANRIEFVNFGSTQPITSADLVYVGSVDGTPFYARRTDVGAFQTDLDARMRISSDLGDMLEDAAFADRFVNEIQTFYVPVEPARGDCVFQPVTSTHIVRRTRG
jgi:opacity protein-like surface antigen